MVAGGDGLQERRGHVARPVARTASGRSEVPCTVGILQSHALLTSRRPLTPLNRERPQLFCGHDCELPQTLEILPLVDGVGGLLLAIRGLWGAGPDDLLNGEREDGCYWQMALFFMMLWFICLQTTGP